MEKIIEKEEEKEVVTKKTFKKVLGIPIALFVIGLLVIGGATAALLDYYGVITLTVNVEQSILVDGHNWDNPISDVILEDSPGGEMFCFKHTLENRMSVEGTVDFYTICTPDCEGITTTIYGMPETTTLTLCDKNPETWECINSMTATLIFDTVNPRFVGTLTTKGLPAGEYALIYYTDEDPRFAPNKWGGKDGKVIVTFSAAESNLGLPIDKELDMNLPSEPDWNINPGDEYCGEPDNYVHCAGGAKIWIVKTSDLTESTTDLPLVNWNPSEWLFETDLIAYLDCNKLVEPNFPVETGGEEIVGDLTIPSDTEQAFLTCYDFAVDIESGTYIISTYVEPVV